MGAEVRKAVEPGPWGGQRFDIPRCFTGVMYSLMGAGLASTEEEKDKILHIFGLVAQLDRSSGRHRSAVDMEEFKFEVEDFVGEESESEYSEG